MKSIKINKNRRTKIYSGIKIKKKYIYIVLLSTVFYSCGNSSSKNDKYESPSVPVIELIAKQETITKEYPASIQAVSNIEIRPQVEGILDKIYIEEGSRVTKGQLLFQINDRPFVEKLNQAIAHLEVTKSELYRAQQEVDKKQTLLENKVITDFQLKTATSERETAKANLKQANAAVENARINLAYTQIKANTDGFIGKLQKKEGSLVGPSNIEALTTLSDNRNLHVYFALSENDFMSLRNSSNGTTMEEKIKSMPPVKLILSDQTEYDQTGKIDVINSQFETNTASISLRATFGNPSGFLRNGNTGKIQIPTNYANVIVIPQESVVEMQGKVFVFKVEKDNKINQQAIEILGQNDSGYLIKSGLVNGDKIVVRGIELLKDGQTISPVLSISKEK